MANLRAGADPTASGDAAVEVPSLCPELAAAGGASGEDCVPRSCDGLDRRPFSQDGKDEFHALARRLTDEYDRVSSELLQWRARAGGRALGVQIAAGVEEIPVPRQFVDPTPASDLKPDCLDRAEDSTPSCVGVPGSVGEAFVSERSDGNKNSGSTCVPDDVSNAEVEEATGLWPTPAPRSASRRTMRNAGRATKSNSATLAGCFVLESVWLPQETMGFSRGLSYRSSDDDDDDETILQYDGGVLGRFIVQPSSPKLIVWDLVGAFLIFFDLFIIPLGAFPYPRGIFTDVSSWVTLMFWTVNMFSSLFVGYVDNGVIIMNPRQIALNYVKSWFTIDCAVVIPDWVFSIAAIVGDNDSSGSSVRLLRILRLVRMTRLVRLLKLRKLIQKLHDMVDSEYLSIVMNILKMILILLVCNHVIACLWFFVGSQNSRTSWIVYHGFADEDWGHQYAVSYHWSITQFTPASMHVQPQTVPERVFAISIVVFALVGFAYVIGSITGSLTQLRQMQEEATKQFWNLRRYLKHKKVPLELCARIQCYLEHAWENEQRVQNEKKVRILSLLSEQLHSELQYMLYADDLGIHPLFGTLTKANSVTMHRLSHKAMTMRQMARRDPVFVYQEKSTHMYMVLAGTLRYSHAETDVREIVEQHEDWISEASLWTTKWVHLGSLNAVTESNLLLVSPKAFAEIVQKNPQAYSRAVTYARNFLEWLNNLSVEDLSDIFQGELVSSRHLDFCEVDSSDDEPSSSVAHWGWRVQMTKSVTRMIHAGTSKF